MQLNIYLNNFSVFLERVAVRKDREGCLHQEDIRSFNESKFSIIQCLYDCFQQLHCLV